MNDALACPRWDRCSAPLCPLDPEWRRRTMQPSESTCAYLRELAKPDGRATLARCLPSDMVDRLALTAPAMIATVGPLRRALRRVSGRPSRLASFLDRQREPRHGP